MARAREEAANVEDVIPPTGFDVRRPAGARAEEAASSRASRAGGALRVLRRGLRESPELRAGLGFTIALSFASTVGRLLVPILVQQVLDKGIAGPHGFNRGFTYSASAIAAAGTVLVYLAGAVSYRRLVQASEGALYGMRVRTFRHI